MVKNKIFQLFLFIFIPYLLISEEDIKIEISIDKKPSKVNEVFQIDVKINGASENITVEDINNNNENVVIKYVGETKGFGISTIDKKRYDYFILTFISKISKPGDYEIGPFTLNIQDKKYTTDLLKVSISNTEETSLNQEKNDSKEKNEEIKNYYIFEVYCNKNEAYVNEPIDIEVSFYNRLGFQNASYKNLSFPKTAWIERIEINEDQKNKIQKNNHTYAFRNIEKERIFISNPGIYSIDPAVLEFIGLTNPTSFSVPEHIILKTNPLTILIKPLPNSAPSNYNGAIGDFILKVELEPLKLKAKESATLKIFLEGDGNFQNINDFPFIIDDSFETYSTNSTIEKKDNNYSIKSWETILVPSKAGKFNLKLYDFHYFDLKQENFNTIYGKIFTLNVTETNKDKKDEIDTQSSQNNIIEKNENDIINKVNLYKINYIKLFPGNRNNIQKYRLWFNVIIILYIIVFILLILFILNKFLIFNIKIKNDNSNKTAYKNFILHINNLKRNINKISFQKEIDNISNIIEKYFILKFHIDSVEFTPKGVDKKLSTYLSAITLDNLKDIINKLNFNRFSGKEILKEDFIIFIDKITNLIKEIEFQK